MHNSSDRVVAVSKKKTEPRVKLLMAINVKECTAHNITYTLYFFTYFLISMH